MNKTIWIILAAVIILGGGIALYANQNSGNKTQTKNDVMMQDDSAMQKKDDAMVKEEGMMDKKDESMMENKDSMTKDESAMMKEDDKMSPKAGSASGEMEAKPGLYTDYSSSKLAEASANGKAVLFFWASWCPFCKAANEAFLSRASEIPSGVTVLKTNYDTEKDLKAKYGVTYQHTFVQVDAQGNMLSKWNGGDIDSLKANLK